MRPLFETSLETVRIVELFRQTSVGSIVSFDAATKATGIHVHSSLPAYTSAKRIALRDHGIVIEGIRGVGFTRLNGMEMVGKGHRTMAGIRRAARRGAAVAEIAIRQNLPRQEMIVATEQAARFRIVQSTATAPHTNRQRQDDAPRAEEVDSREALRNMTARPAAK